MRKHTYASAVNSLGEHTSLSLDARLSGQFPSGTCHSLLGSIHPYTPAVNCQAEHAIFLLGSTNTYSSAVNFQPECAIPPRIYSWWCSNPNPGQLITSGWRYPFLCYTVLRLHCVNPIPIFSNIPSAMWWRATTTTVMSGRFGRVPWRHTGCWRVVRNPGQGLCYSACWMWVTWLLTSHHSGLIAMGMRGLQHSLSR